MQAFESAGDIPGPVFIAGATGRTGRRVAGVLAERGVATRLGVRKPESEPAKDLVSDSNDAVLVQYNAGDSIDQLQAAIGDSCGVVCAIGSPRTLQGPPTVDYKAVVDLARAARGLNRDIHFVMISSVGVGGVKFPAVMLNLFFGVLVWKSFAEDAVRASRMKYTIIRPAGMERPKDDFKDTHNIVLSPAGTYGGGSISMLQIAEVAAEALASPDVSSRKTIEVIATTEAPKRDITDLFALVERDSV